MRLTNPAIASFVILLPANWLIGVTSTLKPPEAWGEDLLLPRRRSRHGGDSYDPGVRAAIGVSVGGATGRGPGDGICLARIFRNRRRTRAGPCFADELASLRRGVMSMEEGTEP